MASLGTTTVIDRSGNRITLVNHPYFDEPRTTNLLPPFNYPMIGGMIRVMVNQGFWEELFNASEMPDNHPKDLLKVIDQEDRYYNVCGMFVYEDLFENIFEIAVECGVNDPSIPILNLRRTVLHSSGVYMMQSIKDPTTIMKIIKT